MALKKGYAAQDCSLARTLELVGERWTMLVVRDAFYGVRRYSDFLVHLGIPRAVLSARLGALTESGVLVRQRYEVSPPRDEYVLTDKGEALWPALFALLMWGQTHAAPGSRVRRVYLHASCGARLTPSGGCEGCGIAAVPPRAVETRPGPDALTAQDDPVTRALRHPHRLLDPLHTT